MTIKEIYEELRTLLMGVGDGEVVKHVGWWNQNVAFIEQEAAWDRPAVFIEFLPITWQRMTGGYRGAGSVRLHIVVDAVDGIEQGLDVVEKVVSAMNGWEGTDTMHLNTWSSSQPNHDHEELVEHIETWEMRVKR